MGQEGRHLHAGDVYPFPSTRSFLRMNNCRRTKKSWFQNTALCLVEEETLHNCKEKLKMEAFFFNMLKNSNKLKKRKAVKIKLM